MDGSAFNSWSILKDKNYVTPEMFGAVGDGVTDDTDSIQCAFSTGKDILLNNNYAISNGVHYSGNRICGEGKLKVISNPNTNFYVLEISSENITIQGIHIDCSGIVPVGIYLDVTNNVYISNVEVCSTNNDSILSTVSCSGIFIQSCSCAQIERCHIHDINRTKIHEKVVSSTGMVIRPKVSALVRECLIERISCSNELRDCDGIYVVSNHEDLEVSATIENCEICDSTGRFLKLRVNNCYVSTNQMKQKTVEDIGSNSFAAIDIQSGSGCIINNLIDFGDAFNRFTQIVRITNSENTRRLFNITGNYVISTIPESSANPKRVRSVMHILSDVSGECVANIDSNIFCVPLETCIYLSRPVAMNNKIKVENNEMIAYQVFQSDGLADEQGRLDIRDTSIVFRNNKQIPITVFTNTRAIETNTGYIKTFIYKNNEGFSFFIDCQRLSYLDLEEFEGYFRGYFVGMSDLPQTIGGDGKNLYMIKTGEITYWAYPITGTSGIMYNS